MYTQKFTFIFVHPQYRHHLQLVHTDQLFDGTDAASGQLRVQDHALL